MVANQHNGQLLVGLVLAVLFHSKSWGGGAAYSLWLLPQGYPGDQEKPYIEPYIPRDDVESTNSVKSGSRDLFIKGNIGKMAKIATLFLQC